MVERQHTAHDPLILFQFEIDGADEDAKPWKVVAEKAPGGFKVDFSPKGGPAGVLGKQLPNGNIKFPDGNIWRKLS